MTYIFFALTILFSALVQGMTSFGFSLVALPVLALFLGLDIIVPILVILSLFLNLTIIFKLKGYINIKKISILLFTGVIFTQLGVKILVLADENILKFGVGILLLLSSFVLYKGYTINMKKKNLSYLIAGIFSGILNGSLSFGGPPIVVMLAAENEGKDNFRKNLTFYFLCLNFFTVPSFFFNNLMGKDHIPFMIIGIVSTILGSYIGVIIGNKIDEGIFRKLTLGLIGIMGIITIISTI